MADRRETEERRNKSERRRYKNRRHLNDRIAVIEIAGFDLRVVVLGRTSEETSDRVQVAVIPWRIDASSLNSELGVRELGIALRSISFDYHLHSAPIHFVLGGEFCVTKAIRGTTEEVRSELQQLKLRSRLYLMLGPGEKVSVSNSRPIDARHEHAVAAICNQKTLETIHSAANNAGMRIETIEPALVSISRVIGRIKNAFAEPSLVVDLNKNSAELGICHKGQLLLDYRPGGVTKAEELVELVRTHLSRLQRHVGRQLHEAPPKLRQVYLCGEKSAVDEAIPAFAACEQFKVLRIDPHAIQATWEFENAMADSAVVPALGVLLSTYMPENDRDAPNFMDHILASTRVPLSPILLRSAVPLVAVLLVACSFLFINYRNQAAVNEVRQKVDLLLPAQGRARELQLQLTATEEKLKQMNRLAAGMQALPADRVVGWIGQCMPSDVWLSSLVVEEMQSIKLTGVSYLEAGVFDFVRWLEQSPYFADVALRGTRPGQSPSGATVNFDVELNINDLDGSVKEVARND